MVSLVDGERVGCAAGVGWVSYSWFLDGSGLDLELTVRTGTGESTHSDSVMLYTIATSA